MALQLTGAFKEDSLANLQARLPGRRHRRRPDRASTPRPSCWPTTRCRSRRCSSATKASAADHGEEAAARAVRRRGARDPRRAARAWPRGARRARARAARRRDPRLRAPGAARGAASRSPTAARWRTRPAYRLNHEEVIKSLEEGIAFIEGIEPEEAVPDEYGTLKARALQTARRRTGRDRRAARRGRDGGGRHDAQHHLRKGAPRRASRSTHAAGSSRRHKAVPDGAGGFRLEPAAADDERLLHLLPAAAASSRSTATTTRSTPATSSRRWPRPRTATGPSRRLFHGKELARWPPAAARRRVGRLPAAGSTTI